MVDYNPTEYNPDNDSSVESTFDSSVSQTNSVFDSESQTSDSLPKSNVSSIESEEALEPGALLGVSEFQNSMKSAILGDKEPESATSRASVFDSQESNTSSVFETEDTLVSFWIGSLKCSVSLFRYAAYSCPLGCSVCNVNAGDVS